MKYKTLNDKIVEGNSHREVAEALWQLMMTPEPTLEEWMAGSARRAKEWDGSQIRTSSPEEHVEDLISAGFLTCLA